MNKEFPSLQKLEQVKGRIKGLGNSFKGEVEGLKKSCQDLIETYISPKDRKIGHDKEKKRCHINHICCLSENIKWDEDNNQFYCDYCWETGDYWNNESFHFLIALKNKCYITDLGLCLPADQIDNKKVYGTLSLPPEVLQGGSYIQVSDIYYSAPFIRITIFHQNFSHHGYSKVLCYWYLITTSWTVSFYSFLNLRILLTPFVKNLLNQFSNSVW